MNSLSQILVLLGIPGVLLLVWGIRGRRVGAEPRCRKCEYDLTGLDHLTCPECGTDHAERPPRVGSRKRRKGAIVVGLGVLACAGGLGFAGTRPINWYSHMPVRLLLWLAEGGDSAGFKELSRRATRGALSADQASEVVDICLAKQARATPEEAHAEWLSLLDQMDEAGGLTAEQREAFWTQIQGPHRFTFRDPIAAGDPVVIDFTYLHRAPMGLSVGWVSA